MEENKKVLIETSADLFKLPLDVIKNTPLYHFKGKYFQKLYEEALKIERSGGKIDLPEAMLPEISNIQFEISYFTSFGQEVYVVGDIDSLGSWKPENALKLTYKENGIWSGDMKFSERFEFKFIIVDPGNTVWETSENRVFDFNLIKDLQNDKFSDFELVYEKDKRPDTLKLICKWR